MRAHWVVSSAAVGSMFLIFSAGTADAITLPDSSSCNSTTNCFHISNTNGTGGAIVGSSVGTALFGTSTSGIGVEGVTTSTSEPAVIGSGAWVGVFGAEGGTDSTDCGVKGVANSSGAGSAVFGDAGGSFVAWAGNFNGDVNGRDFYGNTFNPSDVRLKTDIANAPYGLKEIMKLRPVTYSWNEPEKHGNGRQVGLIAQEVQPIIPELVKSRGPDATLALNYAGLVPVLVKALQEQQAIIQEQGRELAALQVDRKSSASLSPRSSAGAGMVCAFAFLPIGLLVGRRLRRQPGRNRS